MGFSGKNTRVVAISFSRGPSQPRDRTYVSCTGRQILYQWVTWEPNKCHSLLNNEWNNIKLCKSYHAHLPKNTPCPIPSHMAANVNSLIVYIHSHFTLVTKRQTFIHMLDQQIYWCPLFIHFAYFYKMGQYNTMVFFCLLRYHGYIKVKESSLILFIFYLFF